MSEFADHSTSESVSRYIGYKLNNVLSGLEHVRTHEYVGEPLWMPRIGRSLTFEKQEPSFQPYFLGCQGPSKMKCNTTVSQSTDLGHDWCGVGCGSASSQGRPTAPSHRTSQRER